MSEQAAVLDVDVALRLEEFELRAAFQMGPGVTGLFGPSGAGKTTLLNIIAGLLKPDEGRVRAGSRILADTAQGIHVARHRRRIALVHQDAQLFPHLTVGQNLSFGRWFAGGRKAAVEPTELAGLLGIAPLHDRRPSRLSGGERQRVALARAILAAPDVLLLDEPFASLDAARRREALALMERVRDGIRVPMLFVSHHADDVRRLANSVICLDHGRIARIGPPHEVLPA